MNNKLTAWIKKYYSNALYSIIIILIFFLYYTFVFKQYQSVIKSQTEHQFVSDMKMKALLLDNTLSKNIQGVKSISSRSTIRNKIIEYQEGSITFDELKTFTLPKYKEGIKALENIIWARRYIHSDILIEQGNCNQNVDTIIAKTNKNKVSAQAFHNDTTLVTFVSSPIFDNDNIIGQDIICFNTNTALNKIINKEIKFNILPVNKTINENQIYYSADSAICNIKSDFLDASYEFSISQERLFHDLNSFYKNQTIITLLLLTSLTLILHIFHRKKQLTNLQKSEYFETLAAQKTAKLNQTVNQLLELNKQKEESEKRFKTIYEDNRSIMMIINPKNYQIEDANNAALDFYGYTKEQLANLKIYDLNVLPREKVKNEVNTVIIKNKAYFNFKHKLANGEIRDVEVYSSPIEFDDNVKLISIVHDITERKLYKDKIERLNVELSNSIQNHQLLESKLKTIVDMSPIAIIMSTGTSQKIDYINPVFMQLLGYTIDDFQTIPEWWSIAIPDKNESEKISFEWNERVKRANENNSKINPIEVEVTCKNGSKKRIKWGYISSGIQNWAFGIDLTELRNTEKHLRKAKLKVEEDALLLQELNATKDKFFRIVAHDLKSPFNAILGFTSTLLNNFTLYTPEDIKKYVQVIDRSAKNTYGLLENLLTWSQAQTGKTIYKPKSINVKKLIYTTIIQLEVVASAKNISIIFDVDKELNVFADENMLNTVLRNLINNAIKFTPEDGRIEVNAIQNDSDIIFIVKDNGVGMSEDIMDKLFKIEEKISTKGTNNESGTGLGLLLANEFIKKHNGSIDVESEPGKGSIFKIQLPLN
ncbi:sensor histidine kinase [Plebeiibacterium sediminum]|uniref:histidine kinase n=1 Tax=Plebeiibacterium sediminum TaxID=2992112 RepID=A0AAE3SF43_9BACT|nr:ATP-binding protein [Plebeiobacterium sediminum]MCW3786871.1 ATP-binding protein [Plebeiobacterium sediminum]